MLITFLIAMLALIIAVVGCAAINPGYHANSTDEQDAGAPDWKAAFDAREVEAVLETQP